MDSEVTVSQTVDWNLRAINLIPNILQLGKCPAKQQEEDVGSLFTTAATSLIL